MAFRDFRETGPRPVGKGSATGASATPTFLLANDLGGLSLTHL